jgi:hypothetical protein
MKKSNYDLVLEIIESYEDEEILNDFKNEFEEGEDVSKEDYLEFLFNYIDDMSETYYIKKNWEYIESGGDESVYDDEDDEDDEDEE